MGAKLSGAGGSQYQEDQNSEINVTPFVDVMLVLLIIFMVAAPLATVSVEVALPPAVAQPAANSAQAGLYFAPAEQPGLTSWTGKLISALLATISRAQLGEKRNPTKERIFIRADKDVLYGDFMGVMNSLQDNGFYSVALVGEDLS